MQRPRRGSPAESTSGRPSASRRDGAPSRCAVARGRPVRYQPSASGRASTERLGRRRAVDHEGVPVAGAANSRTANSASTSSIPGSTVTSSAMIGSTPLCDQEAEKIGLDVAPRLLEPALGLDVHRPAASARPRRSVRRAEGERVGQRVGGVGREQQGGQPRSASRRAVAAAVVRSCRRRPCR